jgi:hypothetical protein
MVQVITLMVQVITLMVQVITLMVQVITLMVQVITLMVQVIIQAKIQVVIQVVLVPHSQLLLLLGGHTVHVVLIVLSAIAVVMVLQTVSRGARIQFLLLLGIPLHQVVLEIHSQLLLLQGARLELKPFMDDHIVHLVVLVLSAIAVVILQAATSHGALTHLLFLLGVPLCVHLESMSFVDAITLVMVLQDIVTLVMFFHTLMILVMALRNATILEVDL